MMRIHETSMRAKLLWILSVYGLSGFLYAQIYLLDTTAGFSKSTSELVPVRLTIMAGFLACFALASTFKGRHNFLYQQAILASMWTSMGISKLGVQEFRGVIGQTLGSSSFVHDLVFYVDGLSFLLYGFTLLAKDFRIRKYTHLFVMLLITTYYGAFDPKFWDSGKLQTYKIVEWNHYMLMAMVHIFMNAHFSESEA